MPKRARSYRAAQLERLKDSAYAADYINAAMEAGDNAAFLLALRNVAEARTVNSVAHHAGLSRESVYRMLSESGNPCYSSLLGILSALDLQFKIQSVSNQSPENEMWLHGSRLIWEVNDRPRQYFSQTFVDFVCAFRHFGTEQGKQDSAAATTDAPEIMELVA